VMAVVLYAPGGLAGLIMMHAPLVRARKLGPVLRSYALAAPGGLIALLGAIVLLEINYRLATAPEAGTKMKLFGVAIDAATPWPWILPLPFPLRGSFPFRPTCPP